MSDTNRLYSASIHRCQHIKVNGTLCGSPALRKQKYCYFHREHREKTVRINANRRRTKQAITLPVLENADSIQVGVMQVLRLLLGGEIEHKTAGLALYALQIASSNLAQTTFEVARPTMVVVDREKVAQTPLGMTPWSERTERGEEHDPEDEQIKMARDEARRARFEKLALEMSESVDPKTEEEEQRLDELARMAGRGSYRRYREEREKEKQLEWQRAGDEAQLKGIREAIRQERWQKKEAAGVNIQACAEGIH